MRYPGSKAKIYAHIMSAMPRQFNFDMPLFAYREDPDERINLYCEPFFGTGAIGWRLMAEIPKKTCRVIINDYDVGIYNLWLCVRDCHKELISLVQGYEPCIADFYRFKERDGDGGIDPVRMAFEKLVLHQISFSGLGFKAGGPIGGKAGRGKYNVNCRWNPPRIERGIRRCRHLMKRMLSVEILNLDFADVLRRLDRQSFAYIDPPYYAKGAALYKHPMTESDHARLAPLLSQASFRWLLSYDDCPEIRALYPNDQFRVRSFTMTPTIPAERVEQRKNEELLIDNYARRSTILAQFPSY